MIKTALYAAILMLVGVVCAVVFWISSEHTQLARSSAKALVTAALNTVDQRVRTVVTDYSYWDEAYEAALARDITWLYRNIGTAATETELVAKVVITDERGDDEFGWITGGGEDPRIGILPPELLEDLLAQVRSGPKSPDNRATSFAWLDGKLWLFAITRFLRYDLAEVPDGDAVKRIYQIHAIEIDQALLGEFEKQTLLSGFAMERASTAEPDWLQLKNHHGETIAKLTWDLPSPGLAILRKIALPLVLALAAVTWIGVMLSKLAIASAIRLETALEAAQSADRAKTEFLATVSHELRTPMNAVIGLADLLRTSDLKDEEREMVEVLYTAANSHMELLGQLLDFSQIETHNRALSFERFNPTKLVEQVVATLRPEAKKKQIEIRIDSAEADPGLDVLGDGTAVLQILTNFVQNSIKFTNEGVIAVNTKLSLDLGEVLCEFSVEDTGIGISPEDQEKIFHRFTRIQSGEVPLTPGTGLGLAISQSLAQLMGGTISLSSEPGKGSTFTFAVRLEAARHDSRKVTEAA